MEKTVKLGTKDDHLIYSTLNFQGRQPDKVIILVPSLTGSQNDHLLFNAARFFPSKGYATFRFDLYSGQPKGRKLRDCTLATHGQDIDTVISYLKNSFKKLYITGHSWGGPSIWAADKLKYLRAVALWDPTSNKYLSNWSGWKYIKSIKSYYQTWGVDYMVGKKMFNHSKAFPNQIDSINQNQLPTKFILAGKSVLVKDWQKAYTKIRVPKSLIVIKSATHSFDEWGASDKLYQETLKWFSKY